MDFLRDLGRVSLLSDNFCVLASLLEGTSWWMIHMIVTFFIVFQCISYYIYNYMFFQCCFSCFNAQRWNNSRCISSLVVHQKKNHDSHPKIHSFMLFFLCRTCRCLYFYKWWADRVGWVLQGAGSASSVEGTATWDMCIRNMTKICGSKIGTLTTVVCWALLTCLFFPLPTWKE